jgi:hypothetical protein
MAAVYDWGKKEDYGDMATLYRTLFRHEKVGEVMAIPNDLYCFTAWHKNKINYGVDEKGLPDLQYEGNKIVVVHRRWAMKKVRDKFRNDLKGKDIEVGTHNLSVFEDTIKKLNALGPIKWEPYTAEKTKKDWV